MDSHKFEKFLHEACANLKAKYGKVAMLLDNASYHTIMHDDVPNSKWTVGALKKFCADNNLTVTAENAKNKKGTPVRKDFWDTANEFVSKTGMKYRADTIMESYGIQCVRLPPYHPELNPIEWV